MLTAFASLSRILASSFRLGFATLLMSLSVTTFAVTFNVPATDDDGNFSVSWSGARSYAELYHQVNGAWISIHGGSGSGTFTYSVTGKPAGTHAYRLKDCLVSGPGPHSCTETTKSVTVASQSLPVAATPTATPNGGTFNNPTQVSLSTTTAGATIRYTTNNTAVITTSPIYSAPFNLSSTATLRARAYKSGMTESPELIRGFPFVVAKPKITPNGGNYSAPVNVELETITTGATIRYTTNNTAVSTSSTVYTPGTLINLTSSTVVRAKAFKSGMSDSEEESDSFTITSLPVVATPAMNPNGGSFVGSTSVTLTTTTSGATIRYTTNNSTVTSSSSIYTSPIPLTSTTILKAKAFKAGMTESAERTATFTASVGTPTISPNGGSHNNYADVTLATTTNGATIRYTTNNTSVTASSPIYSGPFRLNSNATVRARAFKTGSTQSAESSATFTITATSALTFNVPATDDDGSFAISWSGARSYAELYHQEGGTWVSKWAVSGSGTHSYQVVGLSSGTHVYQLKECLVTGSPTGEIQDCQYLEKQVVVAQMPLVEKPVISPNGGQHNGSVFVTLETATPDPIIRFTTDNTEVKTSSSVYNNEPLQISVDTILRVKAFKPGMSESQEAIAHFVIGPPVFTFNVPETDDDGNYDITWSGARSYAVLYEKVNGVWDYRLDRTGSGNFVFPVVGKPEGVYEYQLRECLATGNQSGPINPCEFYEKSVNVAFPVVAKPVISPAEPTHYGRVDVEISTETSGATIRYTLNNTAVTADSSVYSSKIPLTQSTTVRAKAFKVGMPASEEATKHYIVNPQKFEAKFENNLVKLSWEGVRTSVAIEEQISGGATWTQVYTETATTGSTSLTRAPGTYSYRLKDCLVPAVGQPQCIYWSPAQTVIVPAGGSSSSVGNPLIQPLNDPSNDIFSSDHEYNGTLNGNSSVEQDGSFNYSVAIEIPGGINNSQPKLALSYNSNSKNGLLGWGWRLNGFSAISRCSANMIRDGYVGGIQAGDDYRYCLDGQRLVEVSANEFRTENESFLRIEKMANHWLVTNSIGSVTRYGFNGDSYQTDDQGQAYVWYADQTKDVHNNSWSVTYAKDTVARTHYPQRVDYTQNPSVAARHSIIFEYEDRNDVAVKVVAGTKSVTNKRLKKIDVRTAGQSVKSYVLEYQQQGQTYHGKFYDDPASTSRLAKITACFYGEVDCASPLEFDWNLQTKNNYQFTPSGSQLPVLNSTSGPKLHLDINGDGELEPYSVDDSNELYELIRADGSTVTIKPSYRKADINHDGFDDVIKEFKYVSGIQVFLSNGEEISAVPAEGYSVASADVTFMSVIRSSLIINPNGSNVLNDPNPQLLQYITEYVDLNADGLLDLVRYPYFSSGGNVQIRLSDSPGDISVAFNTGNGFAPFVSWYANWKGPFVPGLDSFHAPDFKLVFMDINGDGALDFLATSNFPDAFQRIFAGINNGKGVNGGQFSVRELGHSSALRGLMGDFNGDGLIDLASMPMKHDPYSGSFVEQISVRVGMGNTLNYAGDITGFSPLQLALTGQSFNPFCGSSRLLETASQKDSCWRSAWDFNNDGLDDIIEIGARFSKVCTAQPLPANPNDCKQFQTTLMDYKAYVYLARGNSQGSVSFSPPVTFKDMATLQSADITQADTRPTFDDFDKDGSLEDDLRLRNNVQSNRILNVHEATKKISLEYKPLTSDEIYHSLPLVEDASDTGLIYLPKITGKRFGVKTLEVSNGIGGYNTATYTYKGSKTHGAGYGDLGFATVEKLEKTAGEPTGIKTITHYHQQATEQYKLAGRVKQQQIYATNSSGGNTQLLSDSRYQWKVRIYADDIDIGRDSPHYFPYLYQSSNQSWDLDGTKISDSLTKNFRDHSYSCSPLQANMPVLTANAGGGDDGEYHTDGVMLYSETATCDNSGSSAAVQIRAAENLAITSTTNTWGHVTKHKQYAWVGEHISSATPAALDVRTQGFSYNNLGKMETKSIEPDASSPSSLKHTSTYLYNGFGSISRITESWTNPANSGLSVTSRVTSINETYGSDGVRTVTVTHPLGLTETTEYHPVFGLPIKQVDANNLVTQTFYDSLGRPEFITYPDSTSTQLDYRKCNNCFNGNSRAAWYSQSKTTGSSAVRTYYDGFNREVGTRTRGLDGNFVYTHQTWNARGSVARSVAPYYAGDAQQATVYHYDGLGRQDQITHPDLSTDQFSYAGLVHESTNRLNQTQTRHLNAAGWVMRSQDNANTPVDFTYWPFGDLKTTQVNNNANTLVSVFYDTLGRKTQLTDPNTGTMHYTYNALGLLATQVDANGQRTCYGYDALGRQTQRVDRASASCAGTYVQHWAYDTKPHGKGLPASLMGTNTDGTSYQEQYSYTPHSLPHITDINFDGRSYAVTEHYDDFNRPLGTTYPTGYIVANSYNDYGHVAQIRDSRTPTPLWVANDADALGNITQHTLGNGVVTQSYYTPHTGRIETIQAHKEGLVVQNHRYNFDALGNLRSRQDAQASINEHFCYDNLNRLKAARANVCSSTNNDYTYDALGNIQAKAGVAGSYSYGTRNLQSAGNQAGPHAVVQANGSAFEYDANGNLKRAVPTNGTAIKTVTYSPFNTPTEIAQGSNWSRLVYGPEQQRIKHTDSNGRTTRYIGGLYEEITHNGVTQKVHYVGDVVRFVMKDGVLPSNDYEYLHRDHLGSVVAITGETLASETDIQRLANGAWGERRLEQWTGPEDPDYIPTGVARAFTDHEHLDAVGLIHMNGRVYDPTLGRFLSADPLVQAPFNSQSYNRYAYVFNNPLSFVDPTGFTTEELYVPGPTKDERDAAERERQQSAMWNSYIQNLWQQQSLQQQIEQLELTARQQGVLGISNKSTIDQIAQARSALIRVFSTALLDAAEAGRSGALFGLGEYFLPQVDNPFPTQGAAEGMAAISLGLIVTRGRSGAKTFSVYQGVDLTTGLVRYVGITSRNPAVRFAEHLKSIGSGKELLRYTVIPNAQKLTQQSARIWEQQLINRYGLMKNNGQLLNQINSIASKYWDKLGI